MIVIDRIEGSVAVVELDRETFIDVPLDCIEGDVRAGATLRETDDGYAVDEQATAARHAAVQEKANRLFRRRG